MEKKSAVEAGKLGGFRMAYQKFTGIYQSSDHINRIHYYIYEPETDLRAIIQIVHDFGDCIERNESFIRFFTDHGIMVCGCDHIGHGRSSKKEDYGYFGEKNGWAYLIKNTKKLTHYMKKEYPDVPYFIYGHGMGSLIVRMDCIHEKGINGVILSGTSGRQKYCRRRLLFIAILKRILGAQHRSVYLQNDLEKRLNHRFLRERDNCSWLVEDEKERKNCSRIYEEYVPITVAAYEDILKMLALVSSKKWYRSVNIEIPIMLIGGQEDPIGNFGKGIEEVHHYLEDSCHRVEMRLYKGMRHNICDEVRKEAVYIDILQWMKLYLNEQYEI